MNNTKYFTLLLRIAKNRKVEIPLFESEIAKDAYILDMCIDCLLTSELAEYGFEENDELNAYGIDLEDAIDYFNRIRIKRKESYNQPLK